MVKRIVCSIILILIGVGCGAGKPPTPPLPDPPAGPVVRIGLLSPTTGEMATFGRMMRSGSLMAFDEQGEILDHRIEWRLYDTGCEYETSRRATRQAIEAGLDLLIGPLCSEAAIGAAEVAAAEKRLLIAPAATHPLVTVDAAGQVRPTVFRAASLYSRQGEAMARFAGRQLRLERAALLIDPADDYSRALGQAFTAHFSGQIVYRAAYPQPDWGEILPAIHRNEAEAIYLPAPPETVNEVARRLDELGLSILLLGGDSWQGGAELGPVVHGFFTTHFVVETAQPWAEAYKATYAVAPTTLAVLGYDAAHILLRAIEASGSFEPEAVAETLARSRFEAVTGPIEFDRRHNPAKPVPIIEVGRGFSTVVVFP